MIPWPWHTPDSGGYRDAEGNVTRVDFSVSKGGAWLSADAENLDTCPDWI